MRAKAKADRRDAKILRLRRAGMKPIAIARKLNVCLRTVYNGLDRERDREAEMRRAAAATNRGPTLTPAFGSSCKPLAALTCEDVHPHGPMPDGTLCCCMVCHKTGIENHPAIRRDPEPVKVADPDPDDGKTRRQKRAEKFAGAA